MALIHNQPLLIVDTKNDDTPYLEFDIESENISNQIDFIRSHYILKDTLGNWDVYEYSGNP